MTQLTYLLALYMNELIKLKESPIVSASKAEMVGIINSYLEELSFNGGDPLMDLALCRKYIFLLEELEKGLKGYAMDELKKFDNDETDVIGTSLKAVETGVKYDFSGTEAWNNQKEKVDLETKKLKEIEAFAKGCKAKTTIVDNESGEVSDYFPPAKSSSTSIRVTLK